MPSLCGNAATNGFANTLQHEVFGDDPKHQPRCGSHTSATLLSFPYSLSLPYLSNLTALRARVYSTAFSKGCRAGSKFFCTLWGSVTRPLVYSSSDLLIVLIFIAYRDLSSHRCCAQMETLESQRRTLSSALSKVARFAMKSGYHCSSCQLHSCAINCTIQSVITNGKNGLGFAVCRRKEDGKRLVPKAEAQKFQHSEAGKSK